MSDANPSRKTRDREREYEIEQATVLHELADEDDDTANDVDPPPYPEAPEFSDASHATEYEMSETAEVRDW